LTIAKKYVPRDDTAPAGIDHLVRIFKTYETVTTSMTVRASWSKAGFEHVLSDGASYLVVNDGKIRDSPDFSQLWRIDFPMERLSERRSRQEWGFMNRQYFQGKYLEILESHELNETIQDTQTANIVTSRELVGF
jgi:hypothetical protein